MPTAPITRPCPTPAAWPAALPAAVAVRYWAVAVLWAVEISCDLGAARETGIWAMTEAVNYKQRTKEGAARCGPPCCAGRSPSPQLAGRAGAPAVRAAPAGDPHADPVTAELESTGTHRPGWPGVRR